MEHHDLDIYPIPREKTALYINEPWLIDKSIMERVQLVTDLKKRPDEESDNIRIYVPLDLNRNAILRRLDSGLSASLLSGLQRVRVSFPDLR